MKVTFKIEYRTRFGESLALVARDRKYPMQWNEGAIWSVTLPSCTAADLADYAYIVMENGLISRMEWKNHSFKAPAGSKQLEIQDRWLDCPIEGCPFPREHQASRFDAPCFRGAGTAVPVFSLRTADDFGIGEFRDLRPLVDWAASTGQCIIQLLPVTDTTRNGGWKDSYPYSPVSSFALHPLYIHLQDIGVEEDGEFKKLQAELNALDEIDYPRVFREKTALMRRAFETYGKKDLASAAYRKFHKENAAWLDEYAEFCARRDGNESGYHCWIQFHLDKQFSEEVDYARSKAISFKGDLPIGVSADSAEAYWHPELFNLDSSTGAPPDFFSRDGQNWGFPTYNWEEMSKNDFAWWKARLRKMSRYFDAFRIDHILGFFRIWEIPTECGSGRFGHFNPALAYSADDISTAGLPVEGLFHKDPRNPGMYQPLISPDSSGLPQDKQERFGAMYNDFFFHRNNEFWRRNAERKLPELLGATGMLACGEDLGMVPDCVPGVMDHWKILSLEMANMDKGRPWPALSVCATSSHDMPTLRMQHAEANGGEDLAPVDAEHIIKNHLDSVSMFAIFPLQDWLAIDYGVRREDFLNERINQPADPDNHWRYRVHLDLRTLMDCHDLNSNIKSMIEGSGRKSS